MKTVYIDSECKCHTAYSSDTIAVETDFFDGVCDAYVEGYRFVPAGATWVRSDGVVFAGEMVAPWQSHEILAAYQRQYEADNAAMVAAYQEGVDSV